MSGYAKQIFLMNKPGVWFLLPSTPLLLFKWSPPHGSKASDEQFTAMPRKWGAQNRKNPIEQPTASSLLRHWFWEDFRKCCQTFLKTGRSSQHWKAFLIDHPKGPSGYCIRPSLYKSLMTTLFATHQSRYYDLLTSKRSKESRFLTHGTFLNYKFDWVVPHHYHHHQCHQH